MVILCIVILIAMSNVVVTNADDAPLTSRKDFMWGVNTHTDFYNIYASTNVEEQMHLMAELGVKLLRTGFGETLDWTDKVVRLANKYGIRVMICNGSVRSAMEDYDADTAFLTAKMIANRYNGKNGYGKVDYIQIDNEVDNYLMYLASQSGFNPGDGSDKNKYVKADVERVCYQFNNYASGIRAADSDVKIVINSGWLHYGFHDWLEEYNVDYDIIGFDWYTDMSNTFVSWGRRPVEQVEFLNKRYGKDIIICETNAWHGEDFDETRAESWDDFIELLNDAYTYPYVLGACVYELCDEAYMEAVNGPYYREAHFGLINADRNGNMLEPKPIYYRLQKLWGGGKVDKILYSDVLKEYETDDEPEVDSSQDNTSSKPVTSQVDSSSNVTTSASQDSGNASSGSKSESTLGFIFASDDNSDENDNSDIQTDFESTVTDIEYNTESDASVTPVSQKPAVTKFVWTTENTLSVVIAGVCILILAGFLVFIIYRNKQMKQIINKSI